MSSSLSLAFYPAGTQVWWRSTQDGTTAPCSLPGAGAHACLPRCLSLQLCPGPGSLSRRSEEGSLSLRPGQVTRPSHFLQGHLLRSETLRQGGLSLISLLTSLLVTTVIWRAGPFPPSLNHHSMNYVGILTRGRAKQRPLAQAKEETPD